VARLVRVIRSFRIAVVLATAGACVWPLSLPANAQATSANYRLDPVTINGGGSPATSATTRLNASLGQELSVGASSAPHFILQSAYWSFLGSTVVPVVLTANRDAVQSADVNLSWSGNNASYNVHRNVACASVFASVLATTSNNAYNDSAAPIAGLTCYNVIAFAPGPAPPPPFSTSP